MPHGCRGQSGGPGPLDEKLCPLFVATDLMRGESRGQMSAELRCRGDSCAWWSMCSMMAVPEDTTDLTDAGSEILDLQAELEVARSALTGLTEHLDIPEDTPFQEIQRLVVEDMGRTDVYEQALQRIYESRLDANEARVEARKALEEAGLPAQLGDGGLR